jgi:adenylyltransferase/sulfurtransferase
VDRDYVDESNLQRQIIFDESDAAGRLPKAVAAARRIRRVNSRVAVSEVVADVTYENVEEIVAEAGVVLDGCDNFETRFLLNDACVKAGRPWVYGAAVGSYGLTMTIVPGTTPCLRCVLERMPEPGTGPTCDTAGVIMPIVAIIGSLQSAEALKLLTGNLDAINRALLRVDAWETSFRTTELGSLLNNGNCPACAQRDFEFLRGAVRQVATTLCGRNAVQVAPSRVARRRLDFAELAARLNRLGDVAYNEFLLRFRVDSFDITVFADARSIIRGTTDQAEARGLYSRYIGL